MGLLSKVKTFFKKAVSAPVESASKALGVVAVVALPALSHAEGETITPAQVTAAVTDIGMPALIGAAVAVMLGIAALIWGGKKIIGFFSK